MENRLHELLLERQELKADEEQLAKALESWKEEALPLMIAMGIDSYKEEGVGVMTLQSGEKKNYDVKVLREALLKQGLPPETIAEVVEEATTRTTYTSLSFRKAKSRI